MKYYCNPININYRYQFNEEEKAPHEIRISREAADPSMILFKGRYYIFASMALGVWYSDDLVEWKYRRLPDTLPLYGYAPDARVIGDYVYVCASSREEICNYYRTRDVLNGPYEEILGTFPFWDPNQLCDDDGRVYFYWGCTNCEPIWGVEVSPETMRPLGERMPLVWGAPQEKGYERTGENHLPAVNAPYIEGAWVTKHEGRYYLQYAAPGTEFNIYADGVYVSDHPLGPYTLAENNPYSYSPGSFMPGAGHGSTMEDKEGNLWHTSTMRISVNHMFERRIGIWPAGFDADGELFCNQRYADWPVCAAGGRQDPWREPDWYLLSYKKKMSASSCEPGREPEYAADENAQTWWRAAGAEPGEWLQMDLLKDYDVRAVQINFADDRIEIPLPGELRGPGPRRYIEERDLRTRWILEGSPDGEDFFVIEDKSGAETDLTHDLVVREEGLKLRYLRLTVLEVPYGQKPCISGLRVFGKGEGQRPEAPSFTAVRDSDLDMTVTIDPVPGAVGYNILWGSRADKLYHSFLTYSATQKIGALVKGRSCYVRVDAFNECGIRSGEQICFVPEK